MSNPPSVGITGEKSWTVERRYCIQRGDYHIFSTPSMVMLAELAAMEALVPCLTAAQVSVGTRVDIQHLAPTLEGMTVRAIATLNAVDGARLGFTVEVFDDFGKVGQVAHERYVLELDRYVRRLEKKKSELAALRGAGGS
jgi:fluoroacetyl-CoA thioesterase